MLSRSLPNEKGWEHRSSNGPRCQENELIHITVQIAQTEVKKDSVQIIMSLTWDKFNCKSHFLRYCFHHELLQKRAVKLQLFTVSQKSRCSWKIDCKCTNQTPNGSSSDYVSQRPGREHGSTKFSKKIFSQKWQPHIN